MPDHRVNKPDYADRAVFEILANALMHRDYSVVGSEVHVDMYDDRVDVYSPGGMPDGTQVQDWDIEEAPSIRRNPIIAEIFQRLDYVERRGSGFRKICEETAKLYGYTDAFKPQFYSNRSAFHVVLKNMNYSPASHDDANGDRVSIRVSDRVSIRVNDIQKSIIAAMRTNPRVTANELSSSLGITERNVRSNIKKLKDSGFVMRIGSDKAGYWQVSD